MLQTEAIQTLPDITDESVGADQLPEDGWTKMAHELLARGEFRLALRAFYLASLAHLAERNLISLARFKSNHDYERELTRRAHAFPALLELFEETVSAFDRVGYSPHALDGGVQAVDLVQEGRDIFAGMGDELGVRLTVLQPALSKGVVNSVLYVPGGEDNRVVFLVVESCIPRPFSCFLYSLPDRGQVEASHSAHPNPRHSAGTAHSPLYSLLSRSFRASANIFALSLAF